VTGGAWEDLGPLDAFPLDRPTSARVAGRRVAVVRVAKGPDGSDGPPRIVVFADACPHAADPLSLGFCERGRVVCRAHGFAFALDDGRCVAGDRALRLAFVRARVRDGRVEASATADPAPDPGC
jgi:nitrite reductase/ring-hydroxylating ferredoxin subunit